MLLTNQPKAMRTNHLSKNCLSYSNHKKESDFSGSYWINDDDNFDKFERADSVALEKKKTFGRE